MQVLREFMPKRRWYESYFTFSNIRYKSLIKHSALFKVYIMLFNARGVHLEVSTLREDAKKAGNWETESQFKSNFGCGLNKYFNKYWHTEYIGGIRWALKKIWDAAILPRGVGWGLVMDSDWERGRERDGYCWMFNYQPVLCQWSCSLLNFYLLTLSLYVCEFPKASGSAVVSLLVLLSRYSPSLHLPLWWNL